MSTILRNVGALALMLVAAGCAGEAPKHLQPLPYQMQARLALKGLDADAPILMRVFKEESELEVWKRGADGKYTHLKTYEICSWSGALGPKQKEGDKQAPEGFYTIRPAQMNPLSSYYLSFNIGYPNIYDRAYGRTGSNLMVHGACSSAGCYSMTDDSIAEIYALAREAFDGGQQQFQVQAYPFRMTDENMDLHKNSRWHNFWVNLKQGYDSFEETRRPPKVNVCDKHYIFNASFTVPEGRINPARPCPAYVALAEPPDDDVAVASTTGEDADPAEVVGSIPKQPQAEAGVPLAAATKDASAALQPVWKGGSAEASSAPTTPAASVPDAARPVPPARSPAPAAPASGGGFGPIY